MNLKNQKNNTAEFLRLLEFFAVGCIFFSEATVLTLAWNWLIAGHFGWAPEISFHNAVLVVLIMNVLCSARRGRGGAR
jgi:hypothetical protein